MRQFVQSACQPGSINHLAHLHERIAQRNIGRENLVTRGLARTLYNKRSRSAYTLFTALADPDLQSSAQKHDDLQSLAEIGLNALWSIEESYTRRYRQAARNEDQTLVGFGASHDDS